MIMTYGSHVTSHTDRLSHVKFERFAFPDPNQKQPSGNYRHYTSKVCVRITRISSIRELS